MLRLTEKGMELKATVDNYLLRIALVPSSSGIPRRLNYF